MGKGRSYTLSTNHNTSSGPAPAGLRHATGDRTVLTLEKPRPACARSPRDCQLCTVSLRPWSLASHLEN